MAIEIFTGVICAVEKALVTGYLINLRKVSMKRNSSLKI